jgi:septum formation protein|uniref:dTTP/UTP pyrophosphatase n=1 Tax=candidate division WOR-3 bacterium TaxID=2052148 RepID=A0A7C4U7E1_UNCW3
MKDKIILASSSPRRIEIFKIIGIDFEIRKNNTDEIILKNPVETVIYNSSLKIKDVLKKCETGIGFDTIVFIDNRILTKPKDEDEAKNFLNKLSGKEHIVYSGFTIIKNNEEFSDYDISYVKFFKIEEDEILDYIKTGEPMDKAGAYAVQGLGMKFIERIRGSITNVIGVPLEKLIEGFKKFSIKYDEKKVEEYLWNLRQLIGKVIRLE